MNKKILLPVLAFAFTLTSCDMDKLPYDAIPDSEALQTPTDFLNMSVPLYTGFRSCVGSSAFYNDPDAQGDDFNAVISLSDIHSWTFTASHSAGDAVYANCQSMIARANFIIDGYNKCDMSNTNLFTPEAIQEVRNVKGEAFITRAYYLYYLAQYFCGVYDESTADDENSGVSYRTDYAPSSNSGTYPARKTLRETYKQITDDLDSAAVYINAEGKASNYYMSVDLVPALYARVALSMKNYAVAAQKAVEVINTGRYTLTSGSGMEDFWWNNSDRETIFKIYGANVSQLPAQTGSTYLPYTTGGTPSYLPTQTVIDLFSNNDYRKGVYFTPITVQTSTGISGEVYALSKYPENGYVWTQAGNYDYARFAIEPKVIRISEMYLIAAEAYAMQGNLTEGAKYLNSMESKRIRGYQNQTFTTQNSLMQEIKNERQREFLGEGMRFLDLKRWGNGIQRGEPQNENFCAQPGSELSTKLSKSASDIHFVWPIPQHEIDTNPQIKQNPGY